MTDEENKIKIEVDVKEIKKPEKEKKIFDLFSFEEKYMYNRIARIPTVK